MTPFSKKGKFSWYEQLVKGNRIKRLVNGVEYAAFHWTWRFSQIDFDKSLGRAVEDYQNETAQAQTSATCEAAPLQNLFPNELRLICNANAKDIKPCTVGLYFLLENNKVVYVGKSDACVRARILSHQRRKLQFDHIAIAEIPTSYEADFIGALNPKYNSQHLTDLHQRQHLHTAIISMLNNSFGFEVSRPPYDLGSSYIKMYCFGGAYIYFPIF